MDLPLSGLLTGRDPLASTVLKSAYFHTSCELHRLLHRFPDLFLRLVNQATALTFL